MSFNICGFEAVFGSTGIAEISEIDILQPWHSDAHWSTYTWYSDLPVDGGNYLTVGPLSGYTRQYNLIYGGIWTEQAMNSSVPFEISYHNFGHESLSDITEQNMEDTFRLGVEFQKRIGSKITAEAPPWNNNPDPSRYPIFSNNGMFVFNRKENDRSVPYEVVDDLWVIPRDVAFNSTTDMTTVIDDVIADGTVLADYSHPEDGFESASRAGFQTSLAYAASKVASGDLWATTLSEIGRYWEAKSDVSASTTIAGGKTTVQIDLTDYDAVMFGIPYLTFVSDMPDVSPYAKITRRLPIHSDTELRVANRPRQRRARDLHHLSRSSGDNHRRDRGGCNAVHRRR